MRETPLPRPCERQCATCQQWLHFSRFNRRSRSPKRIRSGEEFDSVCKACQQIERNEKKNADRPKALIENRARAWAARLSVPVDFLWRQMNWRALVPQMRAMLSADGGCLSCGHPFVNERDIQIDHREPPRHPQDWARQHARNLALTCQSCNATKSARTYAEWLDDQEGARLANERLAPLALERMGSPLAPVQGSLFQ